VLPGYTDEALKAERDLKGISARLLLKVPADQRQNVEAEVAARSMRWTCNGQGLAQADLIRDPDEVRVEILAENGWLPTLRS
jgi:hypothetical protein